MRALLFGLLGGVLLSALRAPLGVELLQIPAVSAQVALAYRAVGLLLVALALLLGGRALEGRAALLRVLGGLAAGVAAHGLLLGRTPESHRGAVVLGLVSLGALVFVARIAARREDPAEAAGRERTDPGATTALVITGAGLALALEGLARHLRLLGGTRPEDDSVFATVLALVVLGGALALGPLAVAERGRRGMRALWIGATAGATLVSLIALNGIAGPLGLERYLRRFDLDGSRAGMLDYDALLAAAVWIAPGLLLGALLRSLQKRTELAAVLIGAALGMVLVRLSLSFELDGAGEVIASTPSTRLIAEGAALAFLGALLARLTRPSGRVVTALGAVLALGGAVEAWRAPVGELPISRPWRRMPATPSFHLDTPEGLLTIERSDGGLEVVLLDGRELSPPTEQAPGERRRLELAFELIPLERRVRRDLRVLLVGQLTPGRALALTDLGAGSIDRSASWAAAMPALERELFEGFEAPEGRVRSLDHARSFLERGDYDLVIVPDVAGGAPTTANLASPRETAVVVWLDAGAGLAHRHLGDVWISTRDLVGLFVGLPHGGRRAHLDAERRGTPATYRAGAASGRGTPLARLLERPFQRANEARTRFAERLAAAAGNGPRRALLEGLARHFAAQRHSSPFEMPVERVELDPVAMSLLAQAGTEGAPDAATVDALEALAGVLVGKRRPARALEVLGPAAAVGEPWPALEDALAYAELELLEPARAAERLARLVRTGGASAARLALLADARLQTGDAEGAAEALWKALEASPGSREIRRRLAIALRRAGDDQALPMLQDLLLEEPDDEELRPYLSPGPYPPLPGGYHPLFGASARRHDDPSEVRPGSAGR